MKSESGVVGASALYLSPSGHVLTAVFGYPAAPLNHTPDPHAAPLVTVVDEEKKEQLFSGHGWPLGAADDRGQLFYVTKEIKVAVWVVRSSRHAKELRLSPPTSGVKWAFRAATRTKNHAILILADSIGSIWATSINLKTMSVSISRLVNNVNPKFDARSVTASLRGDRVFWVRKKGNDTVLAALEAATLKELWTVVLKAPCVPPIEYPSASIVLSGDAKYLYVAAGDRTRGSISSHGVYGVTASDGTIVFGPKTADVWLEDTLQMVPVPDSSSVALLVVVNRRETPDTFDRIVRFDVAKGRVTGEIDESVTTHAIAMRNNGTVIISAR